MSSWLVESGRPATSPAPSRRSTRQRSPGSSTWPTMSCSTDCTSAPISTPAPTPWRAPSIPSVAGDLSMRHGRRWLSSGATAARTGSVLATAISAPTSTARRVCTTAPPSPRSPARSRRPGGSTAGCCRSPTTVSKPASASPTTAKLVFRSTSSACSTASTSPVSASPAQSRPVSPPWPSRRSPALTRSSSPRRIRSSRSGLSSPCRRFRNSSRPAVTATLPSRRSSAAPRSKDPPTACCESWARKARWWGWPAAIAILPPHS